jgi:hypothetical protein
MGGGFGGGHIGSFGGGHVGGFDGARMAGVGHDNFGAGRRFGGGGDYGVACPYYESNVPPYTCDY